MRAFTHSFFLLFVCLGSACCHARASTLHWKLPESSVTEKTITDFNQELKTEVARRVKTFPRPVSVFHYGNIGPVRYSDIRSVSPPISLKVGQDEALEFNRPSFSSLFDFKTRPIELQAPELTKYFQSMTSLFRKSANKWNVGPGLYAAVDPVQSETYMANPWFLLEIKVPAGMRYLDVRPSDSIIVSEAFLRKWFDIDGDELNGQYVQRIGKDRFNLNLQQIVAEPKLREAFQVVLDELKIDAFAYGWSEQTIPYCRSVNFGQSIAFNFINPSALERGLKLQMFTQFLEPNANELKLREYARMQDLIDSSELYVRFGLDQNRAVHWSIRGAGAARLMTMEWSGVLERNSLFSKLVSDPEALNDLNHYFLGDAETNEVIVSFNQFNSRYLKKKKEGSTDGDQQVTFAMYPLTELKNNNPEAYQKRIQLIENSIFGCNPKYIQETIPPEQ